MKVLTKAISRYVSEGARLHFYLIGRDIFWTGFGMALCISFLWSVYNEPITRLEAGLYTASFVGFAYAMWKLTDSPIGAIFMCFGAIFPLTLTIAGPPKPHIGMESLATCKPLIIGVVVAPVMIARKALWRKNVGILEES